MQFDSHYLCRYPRPKEVVFDQGSEFKSEFVELLLSYGIKPQPTTIKNPQANAIIERIHLTMGDMLRTKNFSVNDTWTWHDEINSTLQSIAWALRSTVSSIIKRSPGQLAFNRDMIMQLKMNSNWNDIAAARRKQKILDNVRENAKRIPHTYRINDKILIQLNSYERKNQRKIGDKITKGPFRITDVYGNGIVKIDKGGFEEEINIRRIKPYRE